MTRLGSLVAGDLACAITGIETIGGKIILAAHGAAPTKLDVRNGDQLAWYGSDGIAILAGRLTLPIDRMRLDAGDRLDLTASLYVLGGTLDGGAWGPANITVTCQDCGEEIE